MGVVISDKMQKTLVVAVESRKRHPLYNKTMRRTTRYKVHDGNELAKTGDIVRIVESRPFSREKRWRLAEIVTRREVAEIAPREIDASMLGLNRPHTDSHAASAEAVATAEAALAEAEAPAPEETIEAPVAEDEAPMAEEKEAPVAEAEEPPTLEAETAPAEPEGEAEEAKLEEQAEE
jgi:small subunit ribosomal protein S17